MFDPNLGISKVIYTDLDAVLGGLFTSTVLKPKYGHVDIIHFIRSEVEGGKSLSDAAILNMTSCDVICTCWSPERTKQAVEAAGWSNVRIYSLGHRVL